MNTWLIGTAPDCDVVVDDQSVSHHHCRLTRQPDGFYLEDLNSAHGTVVNGEPITSPQLVTASDMITLGEEAVFPWPADAQPSPVEGSSNVVAPRAAPAKPSPASTRPRSKMPLLIAVAAALLIGAAIGVVAARLLLPEEPTVKPPPVVVDDSGQQEGKMADQPEDKTEKPKEGFKMGQVQADQPIKSIKVTIDVGENGEPLQELVDLHLGLGFPLRLYPVGSDSREPSFAAFPTTSSLSPGKNTVDAGSSAWFEFDVSADGGLDELKTTPTLLSGLTVGDIHSIGFASKGDFDWVLEGYMIEINGALFASNDSVNARANEVQARNDAEMRSRKAEFDALEAQLKEQKDIVDSGLATKEEEDALKKSQDELRPIADRLNASVGLVSGYFPWFQESDPEFKPATPADPPVKSVVVTLVAAKDKQSGSDNPLYLAAGGKKLLLAAAPDFLLDDPKMEQKFELVSSTLKYDPISDKQIKDFAIGMVGSDLPSGRVPDRAKLQRVIVEVDGQVAYNSEQKEVDRKTLSEIRILPRAHRDDLGTLVENSESARQWFAWKPGKAVTEDVGEDDNVDREAVRKDKDNPFVTKKRRKLNKDDAKKKLKIDKGRTIAPVRRRGRTPGLTPLAPVVVLVIPPKTPSGPSWPWASWPFNFLQPPPGQPPVISNVRIVTSGLLRDKQTVAVSWQVVGNTSRISSFRVQLNPKLPHNLGFFGTNLGVQQVTGSSRTASLSINFSRLTSLPQTQRKYLYVEPQVTALDRYGNTINAAATGPIVPVSKIGASSPRALSIGPWQTLSPPLANSPGYQLMGNGFGPALPLNSPNDQWKVLNSATATGGRTAWRLTSFTNNSPLKLAPFNSNMGTTSWNAAGTPPWPRNEVQRLAFPAGTTGGTFTLTYAGMNIGPIAYNNAAPGPIQAGINALLPGLNLPVNTLLVGGAHPNYTITFQNGLGNANLEQLTCNGTALVPAGAVTVTTLTQGAGNDVQKLTMPPTAGNITLRYDDAASTATTTAAPLAYNAGLTAAAVQAQLNGIMPTNGTVTVVGANGGPFTVVFQGTALAGKNASTLLAQTTTPPAPGTSVVNTVSNGGKYLLLRYDFNPVTIAGNMHIVAHMDFINGAAFGANSAQISARATVANAPAVNPTPLLRIDSTKFTYTKVPGGPMQLIDIPIRWNAPAANFNTAFTVATTNSQLGGAGPNLRITRPYPIPNPVWTAPPTAYVSVTFEISQNNAGDGDEGVGVFGVRLVPE